MVAPEKIAHMRQILDEAETDEVKKKMLLNRLLHATEKLSRSNEEVTVEMVTEEIVGQTLARSKKP